MDGTLDQVIVVVRTWLPTVLTALAILIIGWLIAFGVSAAVRAILGRTKLDDRLAGALSGHPSSQNMNTEKWISSAVFWLIMVFVLIAFFQTLSLTVITTPLNRMLGQFFGFLPNLVGGLILLGIAWLLATVLRLVVSRALKAMNIDQRVGEQVSDGPPPSTTPQAAGDLAEMLSRDPNTGRTISDTARMRAAQPRASRPQAPLLSDTLAGAVYWLVFLLFLPAILDALNLQGLLEPVQALLNEVLAFLPNILAAGLILVVGWFVAKVVRRIVTNLASAVGADRLGERVGMSAAPGSQSLSGLLGLLVYVLILVPVLIAALNALQIAAITAPASEMLNTFLTALPRIFAAALVLGIAYFVGRILAGLVANVVRGLGFDRLVGRLGLSSPEGRQAAQATQGARVYASTPEARQAAEAAGSTTPSDWVGSFVLVGVMLFAAIAALNLLGLESLTGLVSEFTVLIGQILLGLVIFGVGLFLANQAARAIVSSRVGQAGLLALSARVAIIALAGAMALRQMGLANEIINLAFGLTLGAIAVAFALAFGLGAREVAGREAERMFEAIRSRQANSRALSTEQRLQQQGPPKPGSAPGD